MKLVVVSDIHGNLPALEAVLDDAPSDADGIVCAGDIVGVLGWPEEAVSLIRERADYCVYGNHDAYIRDDYSFVPQVPSQKQEHQLVTSELSAESVEWINSLPDAIEIERGVHVAHANPFAKNKCGFPAVNYIDKQYWTSFGANYMDGGIAIMGHTHEQGYLRLDKFEGQSGTIINPGSVGAPYFENADYAVIDTETHDGSLHSVEFCTDALVRRFNELDLKSADELNTMQTQWTG